MQSQTGLDPHGLYANPQFINRSEFSGANVFSLNYDTFSTMNYRDVIAAVYDNLYSQYFTRLFKHFAILKGSPAINRGKNLPSNWPDSVVVTDGSWDIGAVEYNDTVLPARPTGLSAK